MDTPSLAHSSPSDAHAFYHFVLLLTGIRCRLRIGVEEHERCIPQLVVIDAELPIQTTQLSFACMPDYAAVTTLILATVEHQSWVLVEEVARAVAQKLASLQGVTGGWVWVAKPYALRWMSPQQGVYPLARIQWPIIPASSLPNVL